MVRAYNKEHKLSCSFVILDTSVRCLHPGFRTVLRIKIIEPRKPVVVAAFEMLVLVNLALEFNFISQQDVKSDCICSLNFRLRNNDLRLEEVEEMAQRESRLLF